MSVSSVPTPFMFVPARACEAAARAVNNRYPYVRIHPKYEHVEDGKLILTFGFEHCASSSGNIDLVLGGIPLQFYEREAERQITVQIEARLQRQVEEHYPADERSLAMWKRQYPRWFQDAQAE